MRTERRGEKQNIEGEVSETQDEKRLRPLRSPENRAQPELVGDSSPMSPLIGLLKKIRGYHFEPCKFPRCFPEPTDPSNSLWPFQETPTSTPISIYSIWTLISQGEMEMEKYSCSEEQQPLIFIFLKKKKKIIEKTLYLPSVS